MYINLNDFFIYVIFLLLIVLLVIGIKVLFKLNKILSNISDLLENNKKNIEDTCSELPIISKNMVEVTSNIKDISEVATEFTADAIITKENVMNNYEILKEIFKIIKSIFF